MKKTIQKPLILSILTIFILNACSSHDVISSTEAHPYNHNFGVVQDLHIDAIIEQEYLSINKPTEIDIPHITDKQLFTEVKTDSQAFLAHEYVQSAPVISYKYKFDPKFYSKAEWRTMNLQ